MLPKFLLPTPLLFGANLYAQTSRTSLSEYPMSVTKQHVQNWTHYRLLKASSSSFSWASLSIESTAI